ncbi:cupin domain-containing protein [Leifsonia sp. P73]|uniref:cupin domain-containing protein n=1 Tax=Leifsonia sp. P73 TaxID=3423959 RepID=UPI003DA58D44
MSGALDATGSVRASGLPLERSEDDPLTAAAELGRFAGLEVGVWEMAPGTTTDVEADEVFVVIAGRARVDFPETGARLELGAGDVVRLTAGDRTVWTVTETLRKVYLAPTA